MYIYIYIHIYTNIYIYIYSGGIPWVGGKHIIISSSRYRYSAASSVTRMSRIGKSSISLSTAVALPPPTGENK